MKLLSIIDKEIAGFEAILREVAPPPSCGKRSRHRWNRWYQRGTGWLGECLECGASPQKKRMARAKCEELSRRLERLREIRAQEAANV